MLPRSFLLPGKPGPAGFGLPQAPAFAHQHVLHSRSSCAPPPHAAATDIASAVPAPGDALLGAAAAVRARQQQQAADGRSSVAEPRPSNADRQPRQGTGHIRRASNGNSNANAYQQQQQHQQQQQRRPQAYQQCDQQQQQQQELDFQQQRQPRDQQQQRPDQQLHRQRTDRPQQQRQQQRPYAGRQQQHQPPPQQPQGQQQQQQQQQRSFIKYQLGADQDWSLPTGLAVTWLGTSSGTPTRDRNISCTLVRLPAAVYMVDCGEGSHRQARSTGVNLEQVETTFITHLHGDHCFGIGSMLVSLCNARRAQREREQQQQQQQQQQPGADLPAGEGPGALRLVGPPMLGDLVSALLVGAGVGRRLDLPVYVTEFCENNSAAHDWQPLPGCAPGEAFIRRLAPELLSPKQLPAGLQARLNRTGLDWRNHPLNTRRAMFEAKPGLVWRLQGEHATITAAQLQHRVPCWGYVFDERTPEAEQQQEEHQQQEQEQQERKQKQQQGRRVLILGDTVDSCAIAAVACGADLVSHEATFAAGMEPKAAVAQHSTAWMAGQFAWAVEARSLVLTHFSARYEGSSSVGGGGGGGGGQQDRGGRGGRGGQQDRRVRSWEVAQAQAEAEAADERAVKALQREAEEFYSQGPILLAADLFTAHVPARQ